MSPPALSDAAEESRLVRKLTQIADAIHNVGSYSGPDCEHTLREAATTLLTAATEAARLRAESAAMREARDRILAIEFYERDDEQYECGWDACLRKARTALSSAREPSPEGA